MKKRTKLRQLKPGEHVPTREPRRYIDIEGYVKLRWTVSEYDQAEVREHRVRNGVVLPQGVHVHHRNGIKTDNRIENLELLSQREHAARHRRFDRVEAVRLYADGASTVMLAARYGVNSATVLRALRRVGVTTRTMREAWVHRRSASAQHFNGPSGGHRKSER